MGNCLTSIGNVSFRSCDSLTSVVIPKDVKTIGQYAFFDCYRLIEVYNLSSVDLGYNVMENGYAGFYAKKVNDTLDSPGNLSVMGDGYVIYTDDNSKEYLLVDYRGESREITLPDSIASNDYKINDYAFYNCSMLEKVTIPDVVTSVGNGAFKNCTSLERVVIPDSIKSISDQAFYGCPSLSSVTIGDGVTSIGWSAFQGCSSLESIVIPDSVTSVNTAAFRKCISLSAVVIGKGVTLIDSSAFDECTSLEAVYYCGTQSEWDSINIAKNNTCLMETARYYYSELPPAADGNFWHYAEDGTTPVIWTKQTF